LPKKKDARAIFEHKNK